MMPANNKDLYTPEIVRLWLRKTDADRQLEEARSRAMFVHRVLEEFTKAIGWGWSVQDAGDEAWRMRGKHAPRGLQQLATETLEGVGWIRPRRRRQQ